MLGMIGLGRMGGHMAERLLKGGQGVVAFDLITAAIQDAVKHGAVAARSIEEVVEMLPPPRGVWVMVPAGPPTEGTIARLADLMQPGDLIIDGGNSYYRDSRRRALGLRDRGIAFLDVGTSGGVWGLTEGYCLMVGGDRDAFRHWEPIFQALAPAPDKGYGYVGVAGSGHFAKMVHNGIEYGMMQAYAEGFELMSAKEEFELDLAQIGEIWRYGSVVRSWLLDLAVASLNADPKLETLDAYVEDSGEGRWTVQEAVDLAVPLPVISLAMQMRFRSRQEQPFAARMLAALRQQFGGHAVRKVR